MAGLLLARMLGAWPVVAGEIPPAVGTATATPARPVATPPAPSSSAAKGDTPASDEALALAPRSAVFIDMPLENNRVRYGSGVILRLRDGVATIATARHVIDTSFDATAQPRPVREREIQVQLAGGTPVAAKVEWVAPHGLDLALLSAPVADPKAREAELLRKPGLHPGDAVWTLVRSPDAATPRKGTLVEIREAVQDGYSLQTLQTDLPLKPGDSGGGLFDAKGRLIGLQTMRALTAPGSGAAPVSFAMPLAVLLDLAPGDFAKAGPPPSR